MKKKSKIFLKIKNLHFTLFSLYYVFMRKIESYNIKKLKNEVVENDNGELVFNETDPIMAFLQCVAKGMPVESACKYAMLDAEEIKKWLEQGKKDFKEGLETPYCNLFTREQRAEAVFEGRMLETIANASKNGNWNASAFLLERRLAASYSNKQEVKVDTEGIQIIMDVPNTDTGEDKH